MYLRCGTVPLTLFHSLVLLVDADHLRPTDWRRFRLGAVLVLSRMLHSSVPWMLWAVGIHELGSWLTVQSRFVGKLVRDLEEVAKEDVAILGLLRKGTGCGAPSSY